MIVLFEVSTAVLIRVVPRITFPSLQGIGEVFLLPAELHLEIVRKKVRAHDQKIKEA